MSGVLFDMHVWGIGFIMQVQSFFQGHSQLMILFSHMGDPRFAFTVYFPVAFYLRWSSGVHVLWTAVIGEWLNCVSKWFLFGERPYWWVHENAEILGGKQLDQYSITCEVGPGSPSGHAMITSAVWYVLVSQAVKAQDVQSAALKVMVWTVYGVMMSGVCISRLFIATHFPHQVVAGTLVGILLARSLASISTSTLPLRTYISTATILSTLAATTYFLLLAAGFDPLWSVEKAAKWCAKAEWVHLDTSLFYSLVRDVSSLLGLGLGLWLSTPQDGTADRTQNWYVRLPLALVLCLALDKVKFSQENIAVFYTLGFVKHMFVVFAVVAGISRINICRSGWSV